MAVVRVGVGCFVVRSESNEEQILIGQRKGSHGAGAWQLPGGHLELNESFEDCAQREVLEETNLEVKNVRFVTATNDIMEADKKHYVTIFMRAEAVDPAQVRVMEPEKLQGEWQWVALKDLPNYQPLFLPLQHFLKRHQSI
ncbi:NUDIX hydrolase domain-like protein [Syncephalastrum racemosum]|uniref:NUDIX hydrolase domain-like protein n=1 Tax=Syncephalastrum racemosum TaxID=13706 RepID=A0A1X2HJ03_SYNRA|nr:NUDIX hydrolase domain-like protein [Syncephalastrum racemosum]